MMTRIPILKIPNSRLRIKCVPVVEGQRVSDEIAKMWLAGEQHREAGGMEMAGLAHNQIGGTLQIIIVDTKDFHGALVNPEIVMRKGDFAADEQCLSCPGEIVTVHRAHVIKLNYVSENGNSRSLKCQGYTARVIQHEMDHLDGILIVDKKLRGVSNA